METLGSFVLAALALAGSPGPNTLSLAAVGAAFNRTAGLKYMVGLTLGMVAVIALVGSGLSGLLIALPGVAPVITVAAAFYFAYLAYRITSAPPISAPSAQTKAPRWFEGMLLSLVNPKAYIAMAAMFSGFVLVRGDPVGDGITKGVLLITTIIAVNICWLLTGSALTGALRDQRLSRIVNLVFAGLLILSVLATLLL